MSYVPGTWTLVPAPGPRCTFFFPLFRLVLPNKYCTRGLFAAACYCCIFTTVVFAFFLILTIATISIPPLPTVRTNKFPNLRKFAKEKLHRARKLCIRVELDNDHALRLVYISPSLESRPCLGQPHPTNKKSPSALMKSRSTDR